MELQSARSVWRQRSRMSSIPMLIFVAICTERVEAKRERLRRRGISIVAICTERVEAKAVLTVSSGVCPQLQSARSVWRQRESVGEENVRKDVAICTGRVEAKIAFPPQLVQLSVAICTRRVEAKSASLDHLLMVSAVAICMGRVEDLASSPEKNPRKFMQTYCIFIHSGV